MIHPHRVGLDIDNVLADWNAQWVRHIKKHRGKIVEIPVEGPATWHWDKAAGLSPVELNLLWEEAHKDKLFWETIRPLPHATYALDSLDILARRGFMELYFITNRKGLLARRQTEKWLERWGVSYPTVILTDTPKHKGEIAHQLELDFYIDDYAVNLEAVEHFSPSTALYVAAAPYNVGAIGTRVASVREFADSVIAIAGKAHG
jgi:uncharacterized HAD superfamily protein